MCAGLGTESSAFICSEFCHCFGFAFCKCSFAVVLAPLSALKFLGYVRLSVLGLLDVLEIASRRFLCWCLQGFKTQISSRSGGIRVPVTAEG